MRVGIDYRILTVGPSAATRGMPRYTQQQLREVLARGGQGDDEYLLFCDPRADQSLILPEIRNAPNVSVRLLPQAVTADVHDDASMLAKAEVFESWLASQDVALYHATTPFYLDQLIVADHDACPFVASVYDLIPLIYPSQYLPTPKLRQLYLLAATMVSRATRLLAISQSARRDASRYLGFPEDRIDVASPIAEPFFRPLDEGEVRAGLAPLRARLQLPGSFILSVSDLHFTKNLETLLRGYALLPTTMRAQLPLVVACHLSHEHAMYLRTLAEKLGVGGQVLTTGLVSDRELVGLYNGAMLVVHPSRYEGFGLPVLEAMQCGTPVITTSSSSLPEVSGGAADVVDPDDAPAFAAAMQLLAEDPGRREQLRDRGLARASAYSGARLADATLAGYAAAVEDRAPAERARIAVWAPLPPLRTGVADHTAELVASLQSACDVELFVDDGYLPRLDLLLAHRVRNFRAFDRLSGSFDAVVYQVGASVFHLYMEEPMRRHPGVVVLHDLVWGHLIHHGRAARDPVGDFRRELLRLEGEDALAEYDGLAHREQPDGAERLRDFLGRHLMLAEIVSSSRAQIVHFPAGADELSARYPDARAFYVPMGVSDPFRGRPELRAAQARARLGIAPSSFVVGVFGIVDEVKRIEASIRAMAELAVGHPDSLLLVVGPVPDPAYGDRLVELARGLGMAERLRLTGFAADDDFHDHLAAVDVVVNLRSPSRKQMSATVLRAAAAGKPVILTDLPEWRFLPSAFCLRVSDADGEGVALTAHLSALAADPALRAQLSAAARAYHEEEGTMTRMAARVLDVLEMFSGRRLGKPCPASAPNGVGPAQGSTRNVNLNKVCEIEDFADPDVVAVMRDVFSYKLAHVPEAFPRGMEYRKEWEIAMAVRSFRDHGVLRPDAVVLGVAAGTEDTSFYLTRHVARVVATDRYLSPGVWKDVAPSAMLVDPAAVAPYDFDQSRLVVQHMDGRRLRFGDDTFDGTFSSGSIEHFGDLSDIASASYEMGRVLKPGGVLTLSTEMLLTGPPGGNGIPGTVLFSPGDLRRYVIDASGLELVDELQSDISQATLASQRDLSRVIGDRDERVGGDGGRASRPGDPGLDLPHLVLVSEGYVFTSVHLALRKTERYPATPNEWARPSPALERAIDDDNRRLVLGPSVPEVEGRTDDATAVGDRPSHEPSGTGSWVEMRARAGRLAEETNRSHDAVARGASELLDVPAAIDAEVGRIEVEEGLAAGCAGTLSSVLEAISTLPEALAGLAHDGDTRNAPARPEPHGAGWRWCPVMLPNGAGFGIMVDPDSRHELAGAILAGAGGVDWTTVTLMLDLVQAGDVVVDVGASPAVFTLAAATAGCRTVTVEASPTDATLLRVSLARNGCVDAHVLDAAAGEGTERTTAAGGRPSLPVVTVDTLLDELGIDRVAVVNLDGGGSEIAALRGMAALLGDEGAPPVLVRSDGPALAAHDARPADLLRELDGLGYRVLQVEPERLIVVHPGEAQLQATVDYLAHKGSLERLDRWRVEDALSVDERIARLMQEGRRSSSVGQRVYLARALADGPHEVLDRAEVVALLAEFRQDPSEQVREAAAWSAPPRPAVEEVCETAP